MRFGSLPEWLAWQSALHTRSVDLGLGRVSQVWRSLGEPALSAVVITIAGTNGKGSSVAFAEAILRAGGYRVGCYTSPHLRRYNERIRIDANAVDDDAICRAFDRIDRARGDVPLTYFEFGTLAALLIFAESALDAVVLEVGLGGRLDAVNLIDPDVALITRIGLDHQDWLGDDIEKIGAEKAGIMRAGRPVVFSGPQMPRSIRDCARRTGARLLVAGEDYRVTRLDEAWSLQRGGSTPLVLPQPGLHGWVQVDNAAGVVVALGCLTESLPLDQRSIRAGLLGACVPGRFDVRPGRPTWILDVAHNPQAATALNDMLGEFFSSGRRVAVCGMLSDKDVEGVASALAPSFDAWYFVDLSDEPRGSAAQVLADRAAPVLPDVPLRVATGVGEVLGELAGSAGEQDLVVVFGSFVTVGRAMSWFESRH